MLPVMNVNWHMVHFYKGDLKQLSNVIDVRELHGWDLAQVFLTAISIM